MIYVCYLHVCSGLEVLCPALTLCLGTGSLTKPGGRMGAKRPWLPSVSAPHRAASPGSDTHEPLLWCWGLNSGLDTYAASPVTH